MKYQDYDINELQLVGGGPHDQEDITVQRRRQRDGSSLWSVNSRSFVMDKRGNWVYEPLPSSRTEAHIRRTRWESAEAAIAAYRELHP